jgi:copper transport protein
MIYSRRRFRHTNQNRKRRRNEREDNDRWILDSEGTVRRSGAGLLRAILLLVLVCSLLGSVPLASGHAYLNESDPENGEQVEKPPEEVTLSFSGDGVQLAEVVITGPDGEDVSGETAIDSDDSQLVSAPVEDSEADEGVYTVQWEVLADDGHTTSGTFLFSLGDEPLDREQVIGLHEEDEEGVSAGETAANGFILLSLIGLVGVPATLWIAIYPLSGRFDVPLRTAEDRVRSLLALFGVFLFVGVFGLGLARSTSLAPSLSLGGLVQFLGTSLGVIWVVQLGVASGVLGTLLLAHRREISRRYWLGGAVAGGIAIQLSVSATSHSASLVDRFQGTLTDFAHISGAALWVGGLLVLAVVLPHVLQQPEDGQRVAAEAIRRFSVVALAGVTLAVTTGLLLAAWHAPDPESLRTTLYETVLSTKTLLVCLALGLGGLTRFVLLRRLKRGETGVENVVRAVRFEMGVLIVVVLLSGLITATPTAAIAEDEPSAVGVEGDGIELTVTPAEDGGTAVLVDEDEPVVIDATFYDDGEQADVEDPQLLIRNDQFDVTYTTELEETDEGVYSTVQTLPEIGSWDVRVSGQVGESYESEWFDLFNVPDHPDHDDHDHGDDTAFAGWLRLGALGVGFIGMLAVLLEVIQFSRRT